MDEDAATRGAFAAQGEEFRDDLTVIGPGEAFFRREAPAMGGVGQGLLAVRGDDVADEHLFRRKRREGFEGQGDLAGGVRAFQGDAAHEEAVARKQGGRTRRRLAGDQVGEGAHLFLEGVVGVGDSWPGRRIVGASSSSSSGAVTLGAPLSSLHARIWKG